MTLRACPGDGLFDRVALKAGAAGTVPFLTALDLAGVGAGETPTPVPPALATPPASAPVGIDGPARASAFPPAAEGPKVCC